jgi:RNA polymerase II subunit A small phosphatase-like protein
MERTQRYLFRICDYGRPRADKSSSSFSIFEGLLFFPMTTISFRESRPALVLDLDDTLITTTFIRPSTENFPIRVRRRKFFAALRPGVLSFIKTVSVDYDLFFFTASAREYGDPIIDIISPETPRERRFFRDSCSPCCGYPVKDLRLLGRPLNRILLIDDLEGSALMQPGNLVRVSPWRGTDDNDTVLLGQLLPLLREITNEDDLPSAIMNSMNRNPYQDLFASKIPAYDWDGRLEEAD